jgi:hypothetical protein
MGTRCLAYPENLEKLARNALLTVILVVPPGRRELLRRMKNEQPIQTSLERRTRRSAISRTKKWHNFRENGLFAFSISQTALDFRELGQSIFWKNFAQIENNTENAGVFANVEKFFRDEAEKIFGCTDYLMTGWKPALQYAKKPNFASFRQTTYIHGSYL